MGAEIGLAFERPLFTPSAKPRLAELAAGAAEASDIDTTRLFDQIVVDKARLQEGVRQALQRRSQVTLRELLDAEPLRQGLAELLAYLELAHAEPGAGAFDGVRATIDEAVDEPVRWQSQDADGAPVERCAHLPRVIFTR